MLKPGQAMGNLLQTFLCLSINLKQFIINSVPVSVWLQMALNLNKRLNRRWRKLKQTHRPAGDERRPVGRVLLGGNLHLLPQYITHNLRPELAFGPAPNQPVRLILEAKLR